MQALVIALIGSISLIPLLIMPSMVGGMIDYYGLSPAAAGWAASLNFLGGAFASIGVALRVRHLELHRVAAGGFLLAAAADGLSAVLGAHSPLLFLLVRFVAGIGANAAYAAIMSAIARRSDAGREYGLLMMMQFALSALGLYLMPLLLPLIGMTGLFLGIAAIELAAIGAVRVLISGPRTASPGATFEYRVLLSRAALLALLCGGIYEASVTAQYGYSERMGLAIDISPQAIGTVLGIASFLGIPGALCIVWIGSRARASNMLLLGIGGTVLGMVLMVLASSLAQYVVAQCLIGFFWAFALPYIQSIQAALDRHGSVVAAGACTMTLGSACGPGLAALVVGEGAYLWVMAIAIALSVLAALMMLPRATPMPLPLGEPE